MSRLIISTLHSSSKGNVAYIKNGDEEFLIDAGVSARSVENSLKQLGTSLSRIKAIFITHEHGDHIRGLEIISKYYKIPIYAPLLCAAHIRNMSPYMEELVNANDDGVSINFARTSFTAYRTPHDALGSVCYKVDFGGKKLGYATDIGHISDKVLDALVGCEYAVIESNHDLDMLKKGPYPYMLKKRIMGQYGHLSNTSCAEIIPLLVNRGCIGMLLAHLSAENNKPELAYNESRGALLSKNIKLIENNNFGDIYLNVASKTETTLLVHE